MAARFLSSVEPRPSIFHAAIQLLGRRFKTADVGQIKIRHTERGKIAIDLHMEEVFIILCLGIVQIRFPRRAPQPIVFLPSEISFSNTASNLLKADVVKAGVIITFSVVMILKRIKIARRNRHRAVTEKVSQKIGGKFARGLRWAQDHFSIRPKAGIICRIETSRLLRELFQKHSKQLVHLARLLSACSPAHNRRTFG